MRRKIIPYDRKLKAFAQRLRNKCTGSEKILWRYLKGKQLMGYTFHRQKPLDHFIADFYCYDLKLVIELDGYTHDFPEVKKKDKRKQQRLESIGLTIIRFKDEEIFGEIDEVIRVIEGYIRDFKKKKCVK
jgi:very-short-patch-repair endonuclease